MSLQKGLRRFWIDSDDIRDRIDGRVYAGRVPDKGSYPCVTIQTISQIRNYHLGGEAGISTAVVQVDVWADTYTEADEIAELIRNRTSGYQGAAGDEVIREATIVREGETIQQPKDGSGKWQYSHSRDFRIFYETAIPTLT